MSGSALGERRTFPQKPRGSFLQSAHPLIRSILQIGGNNSGDILAQLRTRQWAHIKTSLSPKDYARAAEAFIRFVREVPDDKKTAISSALSATGENATRTDLGYRERTPQSDSDGEHKAYFHYHPDAEDLFARELREAGAPTGKFIAEARKIRMGATVAAQKVVRELDTHYPGMYDAFFRDGEEPSIKLRFLLYRKTGPGKHLGVGHYDRNAITLALAESAPGLRVGKDTASLTRVSRGPGEAVVMAGTMIREFEPDKEKLPLSWHDVEKSDQATLDETDARWAIIAMVHPLIEKEVPSLSETHKPE